MMRTIWFSNRNFQVFHVNGKHPNIYMESFLSGQTRKSLLGSIIIMNKYYLIKIHAIIIGEMESYMYSMTKKAES